jgi:phosphatidylserine/phosphatidylglycerophosphate/cardiolipin synthase-like enzyme
MPSSIPAIVRQESNGLTVVAYRGVGGVLLAFDLSRADAKGLAGFAIDRTDPQGTTRPLLNRLSFDRPLTRSGGTEVRRWTDSHLAPFQYFRWVDIPPDVVTGNYTYTVTTRYFQGNGTTMRDGPSATATVPLLVDDWSKFQLGFTRGYLSSQAYRDHFHDAAGRPLDFRPRPITLDYDTTPYQRQYEWLGFSGRKLLLDFLDECVADRDCSVDMFAYDFDEPEMLERLQALGRRLRAFFDNAALHSGRNALEPEARTRLAQSAGADHVKAGRFGRYAHCKVLIKKDATGKAVAVLAGSANFSVRGLYAQANNIFVFREKRVAGLYEDAFNQAFEHPLSQFKRSPIATSWHEVSGRGIPTTSFCFSPHIDGNLSLRPVGEAIDAPATSSVLFAVMQFGGGAVTEALARLPTRDRVFSMGVIDTGNHAVVYSPSAPNGTVVQYDYLHGQVPWPFHEEYGRDAEPGGRVIHDKFVVVDFNGRAPQVFFGSSNLAKGGEEANGDSLLSCKDPLVVSAFAVEAIRNIDHFHFRSARRRATRADPLTLHTGRWWAPWYGARTLKSRDRKLFANPRLA